MKIEIDLSEILGDPEHGVETLQDSVKRQVVAAVIQQVQGGIRKKIDSEVSRVIEETVRKNIESLTPTLLEEMLNTEYVKVDQWGNRATGTTSIRKELVSIVSGLIDYKGQKWDSDKNIFTRSVDKAVEKMTDEFEKKYNKTVNEKFVAEAFEFAQKKLAEKLGIKN